MLFLENLSAVILAAGEGKRMKSDISKVLHKISDKALLEWVVQAVNNAGVDTCVTVIGHKGDQIIQYMGDKIKYVKQKEQLGTGHAVMQAEAILREKQGYVIILNGDTPLISEKTIRGALDYHIANNNSATVITAELEDATGYGRLLRDSYGTVVKIVEDRDASDEEKKVREINSGLYCFTVEKLISALSKISNSNSQGEYYLTDTIEILINEGDKVGALKIDNYNELLGINNRKQLAEAEKIMRNLILNKHMENGVTIIDPSNTYIHPNVDIGMDTIIYPGCTIENDTVIGRDCIIGHNSRIISCIIKNNVEIQYSVLVNSNVDSNAHIGPYAYLRPGSKIGKNVKIGDFVEVKNSIISDNTKVSHLTYIGDADLGQNVNIGCGTITVNYDGVKKHRTVVGDNVFIGCNTNLVAPITVNNNAYIAAGSTITEDVPENALAIARERQTIKENWVIRKRGQK